MNEKINIYKGLLIVLSLLCCFNARAQDHRYQAKLPAVAASGFYKLAITPELSAGSAPDLRDIRIRDVAGREVPYLRSTELPQQWGGFLPFPTEVRRNGADQTIVLLHNVAQHPIEALHLSIRNTAAQRQAVVSGSSDGKTWFALRDSVLLNAAATRGDTAVCTLPLPPTTYPYLQVVIVDKGRFPLEVLGAGVVNSSTLRTHYTPVPPPTWTQIDSNDHHSYYRLRFRRPYLLHKLSFEFEAPSYYRRAASLIVGGTSQADFTVSYNVPAAAWVQLHDTLAVLVLYNEDSPPLRLKSVSAWQQQQYLLAHIEQGKSYMLTFGDSSLAPPVYDYRFFKDSMAIDAMPELQAEQVEAIAAVPAATGSSPIIGKKTMWVIILAVLAVLVIGTVLLMRQIRSEGRESV